MEPAQPLQLDAATIDAVARRVVELLGTADAADPLWVDAAEVARRFGVARSWVYAQAARLGAVRLGHGPRARLRFDPHVLAPRARRVASRAGPCPAPRTSRPSPNHRARRVAAGA